MPILEIKHSFEDLFEEGKNLIDNGFNWFVEQEDYKWFKITFEKTDEPTHVFEYCD